MITLEVDETENCIDQTISYLKDVKKALQKKARPTPLEAWLAEWLHKRCCNYAHEDQCDWYYDIHGKDINWDGYAHKRYLEMARDLLKEIKKFEAGSE